LKQPPSWKPKATPSVLLRASEYNIVIYNS
jgi:hypothetical protein